MKALEDLIDQYNKGTISPEELVELESLIQEGQVELSEFKDVSALMNRLPEVKETADSSSMDTRFYTLLENESAESTPLLLDFLNRSKTILQLGGPNWAFNAAVLVMGIALGLFFSPYREYKEKIEVLSTEMEQLKEVILIDLLEETSSTARLRAVNLTNDLTQVSNQVAQALLKTLREDDNVNVRLASLDALAPYTSDPDVRMGMIDAIKYQQSPLVQMALAELMVAIQEKRAVNEFKSLMEKNAMPHEIREQINTKINILI